MAAFPSFSSENPQIAERQLPGGALNYFGVPTWPATGIPAAPGVGRNSFRGPNFFDVDMTFGKAFELPANRLWGESARINIRADFYYIFNKLNLLPFVPSNNYANPSTISSYDGVTSNPHFGQAQGAYSTG